MAACQDLPASPPGQNPNSKHMKKQAEEEGLDKILIEAGFDWREPGCSMCLAMNNDKLKPQEKRDGDECDNARGDKRVSMAP